MADPEVSEKDYVLIYLETHLLYTYITREKYWEKKLIKYGYKKGA